jgi:hypothetical protein
VCRQPGRRVREGGGKNGRGRREEEGGRRKEGGDFDVLEDFAVWKREKKN